MMIPLAPRLILPRPGEQLDPHTRATSPGHDTDRWCSANQALDLLDRAKQLITSKVKFGEQDDRRKLLAITYNNLSCVFKRKGLLKTALGHAEKVCTCSASSPLAPNPR